jgi:hypothetical protein
MIFLWDARPGSNIDHIAAHGLTTDLWEAVFHRAVVHEPDKDDAEAMVAEGRIRGRLYRIVYGIDGELVMPITIIPITGFPITRRALRRSSP